LTDNFTRERTQQLTPSIISSFDECPRDVEIESITTFFNIFVVVFGFVVFGYFFTVLVFG